MVDDSGEKLVSFRRGQGLTRIVPADAAHMVEAADTVLLDNRYPDFNIPIARAAAARGIPRVLDIDHGDPAGDPLLALSSHVIASADALRAITGEQDLGAGLQALGKGFDGFLAVTNGPEGVTWRDGDAVRHMPAFSVRRSTPSAPVMSSTPASRCGWPRPATWSRRCASAAPPPRSNAPASAGPPARRSGPKWIAFCNNKATDPLGGRAAQAPAPPEAPLLRATGA